ncbi:MAG: class I SAM-dependent methyltransferase [Magnetospirillum sp. WYHS-4]
MNDPTLLDYYVQRKMDPVPLNLETPEAFRRHREKRGNLYDRHLGIPFGLLEGRDVIEFGCNSGENALVLAEAGARVTLVEPNVAAHARLRDLFDRFGLSERLVAVVAADMAGFRTDRTYDLAIAEGFLNTLSNRDAMLGRMLALLKPRGLAVVSFDDRTGGMIEMMKRAIHWQACRLAGIDDVFAAPSLSLAGRLFGDDFAKLNASRPFSAWWEDQLVNPFALSLWSFEDILKVIEPLGGRFRTASPVWTLRDRMAWYKDVPPPQTWRESLREEWLAALPFFLTGRPLSRPDLREEAATIVGDIADLIAAIARFSGGYPPRGDLPEIPGPLAAYLDALVPGLGMEMRGIGVHDGALESLVARYHASPILRDIWGSLYHYLCFENAGA